MSKQSDSAKAAWDLIKSDPERYEARRLSISQARSGVSVGTRKGIGGWKVTDRKSGAHDCVGVDNGCTNGRHRANSTSFQVGSTQINLNSLANLTAYNESKKEWVNGTSYEGQFTYTLRSQVWERDQSQCQDCERAMAAGERAGVVHHTDFDKGHNDLENLVLLCRSCHIGRHTRDYHGRVTAS